MSGDIDIIKAPRLTFGYISIKFFLGCGFGKLIVMKFIFTARHSFNHCDDLIGTKSIDGIKLNLLMLLIKCCGFIFHQIGKH